MCIRRSAALLGLGALFLLGAVSSAHATLRVHPDNPRWLTEDGGATAIVFTGAHTWSIFQDHLPEGEFDALAYLDGIAAEGHNFTRGWFWEDALYHPLPYELDRGEYRLSPPYDRAYSSRLRSRIRAAAKRGLYVSVMLFQGWSLTDYGGLRDPDPWPENPYNRANHRERVTKQAAALHIGVAQAQQLEYVSHIASKLCSEPNLVWEVTNESHPNSLGDVNASNWQAAILAALESACDRRLTWVSCPASGSVSEAFEETLIERMYAMEADLISPCDPDNRYSERPPAADGRKVVLADSDHLTVSRIDGTWAWRAFLRGQHPLFMDLSQDLSWWSGTEWDPDDPVWAETRAALGSIQELVAAVNRNRSVVPPTGLGAMAPQGGPGGKPGARTRPASSRWTLYSSDMPCKRKREGAKCRKARANGDEILAWADDTESLRVCRLAAGEDYRARWKRPFRAGYEGSAMAQVADAAGCLDAANPAAGPAVLHLERLLP